MSDEFLIAFAFAFVLLILVSSSLGIDCSTTQLPREEDKGEPPVAEPSVYHKNWIKSDKDKSSNP